MTDRVWYYQGATYGFLFVQRSETKRVAVDVDPYEYARSIDENRTMFHVIRKVENRSFAVFYA